MTETSQYLVLYGDYNGIKCPEDNYFDIVEGEEGLKESIISAFNSILSKDYENPDDDDFDEVSNNLIVFELRNDKEQFIEDTIQKHLSEKNKKDYKEYLRLRKRFEK